MAILVERATSDLLGGPDWGLNLEICDAINQNPSCSRDVVKAVKKRLSNKSTKVQILTVTVLEMIMKNCGDAVHQMVAEKDVLQDLVKIVKRKVDPGVREKILTLLESWKKIFGGPKSKYPQYSAAYDGLQRSGVQFPKQAVGDTALFIVPTGAQTARVVATETTLAASHTTRSLPQLAYGLPAGLNEVLAASENFVWSAKDLDSARQGLELLNEMLNALDPKDKQAVHNDLIVQLVEQCQTNQKIVRQLVNSTSDESLLCQGLSLNDDIQQVLVKHGEILSRSSGPAQTTPRFPRGHVIHDHEDDESEDELLHLAHRSSSKASRLPAFSLESGLHSNMQHPSSQHTTNSTSGSLQSTSDIDSASLAASMGQVTFSKGAPVLDEHSSMINPFANMASAPSTASYHPHSSTVNDQTLLFSELVSNQSSRHEQSAVQQNRVSDRASSHKSHSQSEHCTSPLPQRQNPSEYAESIVSDDVINPFSNSPPRPPPATEKKSLGSLPPPPILYTERERFFNERKQMDRSPKPDSLTPSSMERRLRDLSLIATSQDQRVPQSQPATKFDAKHLPPATKEARSVDRLFADLVDFNALRNK